MKMRNKPLRELGGDVVWPPVDRQFLLPDISMALNAGTLGLNMGALFEFGQSNVELYAQIENASSHFIAS